jgi:hypothetical protein
VQNDQVASHFKFRIVERALGGELNTPQSVVFPDLSSTSTPVFSQKILSIGKFKSFTDFNIPFCFSIIAVFFPSSLSLSLSQLGFLSLINATEKIGESLCQETQIQLLFLFFLL